MSVRLMGAVFELDVPACDKLVLLAMADHARDDGTGCYPSIGRLAKKTSLSVRSVQRTIRGLENAGFLVSKGKSKGGRGVTTEYNLTLETGTNTMLPFSGRGRYQRRENPARHAPFSDPRTPHVATKTPHPTTVNPARHAPEPSGTPMEPSHNSTFSQDPSTVVPQKKGKKNVWIDRDEERRRKSASALNGLYPEPKAVAGDVWRDVPEGQLAKRAAN